VRGALVPFSFNHYSPAKDSLTINHAMAQTGGAFHFDFAYTPGATVTALFATNPATPPARWNVLGSATETSPGQFQFTDPQSANSSQRFYRLRSP
jgi:hypothetical protein